jgi:hypothetical protein
MVSYTSSSSISGYIETSAYRILLAVFYNFSNAAVLASFGFLR